MKTSPAASGGGLCEPPSWLSLLVIQPSPFCNINCDYCYLPDRSATHRMAFPTLDRIVDEVFESDLVRDSLTMIWHAGEPLAVPVSWYREAFQRIAARAPKGVRIVHSFQSNGTLLNQAWCNLILEFDVKIGLSIDGPELIHDAHRKTRSGRGTHALAMRGVDLLQANNIPFHVIAVVTAQSLDHAEAIFNFFRDHGIGVVGLNVEEQEGAHASSTLQADLEDSRVARFFRRMFQLEKQSGCAVRIREFDFARERICNGPDARSAVYPLFNEQVRPFGILTVDWQGCFSTFSPELLGFTHPSHGDFRLGNVHEDHFPDTVNSVRFRNLLAEIQAGVEACRTGCPYFDLCGGGAPANKLFENGSFATAETMYCRYVIKLPIDLALEDIEHSLSA